MRILVSTSTFPIELNDGLPRFVYDLADALSEHVEVFVLAPDAPLARKRERIGRVHVTRFSYWAPRQLQRLALNRGIRANLRASWLARLQVPSFLLNEIRVTRQLVRRHQIDIVNAHWMIPQGLTAAIARGRRSRFRLVVHVHAGDVYLLRNLVGGRAVARFIVARSDAIFAAGSHVRDSLDDLLGFPSGAGIQPMGVRRDVFGTNGTPPLPDPPEAAKGFADGYILCVGRLVEKKGMVYLIRALPRIREKIPGLGLVIIGAGPEEANIRQEVERLNLKNAVVFLGRQSHQEIVRYLHACRVSVVPSIIDSQGETEGMPTVVVEALAAGVKVVGSRVNGIPDVLRHEDNGWLCQEKSPEDLAEKILMALNSTRSSSIMEAALATAVQYDWKQIALNYMDSLRQVHGPEGTALSAPKSDRPLKTSPRSRDQGSLAILVDVSHPAHVHFFRNAIDLWRQRGHEVTIVSRDKDITLALLDQFGYEHTCLSRARHGVIGLGRELLEHEGRLYRFVKHQPPDVFIEIGGTFIVHAARLLRKPSIVFYDTENARISNAITYPFASAICTPACYQGQVGQRHVRYDGYHELAYLHPNRFNPDPNVLKQIGLSPHDTYFIIRFVGWGAGHDLAQKGFSMEGKHRLVKALERWGRVLITSEVPLPDALEQYRIQLPPSLIHHLLAFSTLYVGESATMASECSVLGVPAIFFSSVGRGYTDEQEEEYGLCFTTSDEDLALGKALDWLSDSSLKAKWREKRRRLLTEKIDVTDWMVRFVEDFVTTNGDLVRVQK